MDEQNAPECGAVVTYRDPRSADGQRCRRAVARGTVVPDPRTHVLWLVVVDPVAHLTLVDPALVIDVQPPTPADDILCDSHIGLLRDALDIVVAALTALDENTEDEARLLLTTFLDTVATSRHCLRWLAESRDDSPLATILGYLDNLTIQLTADDVTAAGAAALTAHVALRRLP